MTDKRSGLLSNRSRNESLTLWHNSQPVSYR